eukprot:2478077-Alexandrium_andersonii.AAC.1
MTKTVRQLATPLPDRTFAGTALETVPRCSSLFRDAPCGRPGLSPLRALTFCPAERNGTWQGARNAADG